MMPGDLPIACSLSATQLPERLRLMAALGRDALLDSHIEGTRAQLRFAAGRGVRERVDAIVAAESRCCPFLTMRVRDEPGAVLVRIEAAAGAEPALAALVDGFAAARRQPDVGAG